MLVGRDSALRELRQVLDDSRARRGRVALITGEPGIGKTRLAEACAEAAVESGIDVAWATCWEGDGTPAYWPWIQLIRSRASERGAHEIARTAVDGTVEIARLVPEIAELLPSHSTYPPPSLDADEQRFRLFDAVTRFFHGEAEDRPLLLIIDDLHWADTASVLLLNFLAASLPASRLCVIGALRDAEARSRPLQEILPELTKEARTVTLAGLAPSEVTYLLAQTTGSDPNAGLAQAVYEGSGGNPLFVRELGKLLVAQGRSADPAASVRTFPAGLRGVIERRTSLLSPAAREVLQAAAIAGIEFRADIVADVARFELSDALEALAEASRMGIVTDTEHETRTYRFIHGLVRDAIYTGLTAARRRELHRSFGEVLEKATDRDLRTSELVYHFARAGTSEDAVRSLTYAEQAVRHALEMLAFEEAAAMAERALVVVERERLDDEAARARLLLLLGAAKARSGEVAEARHTYLRAVASARSAGDGESFARAVLGFGSSEQFGGGVGVEPQLVQLAEEALAALPEENEELRVRLTCRLAAEIVYADPARFRLLANEALEKARGLADTHTLTNAVQIQHQVLFDGSDRVAQRLAVATEMLRLGEEHHDTSAIAQAHIWRVYDLLELGDIDAVDFEIGAMIRLVAGARLRLYAWFPALWRAMRRLLEGRIDEAEVLAAEALELGEARGQGAVDHFGMQLIAIRREQGRIGELTSLIQESVDRYPEIPSYRCALALAHLESGQTESARAGFERLAADDFASIPRDFSWNVCLVLLAEVCAGVGDVDRAELLYELLRPLENRYVVVGYGTVCAGATSQYLGLLAATAGRTEDARRHLEFALHQHRRIGAAAWIVRTQHELARVIRPDDPSRAQELLEKARATAQELHLEDMTRRIDALLPRSDALAPATSNVFRKHGDFWSITFEGRSALLKDAKGLMDLARLLSAPGREIHALDLATAADPGSAHNPSRMRSAVSQGQGWGEEIVDARARYEYRARIVELREEIAEAEAIGDAVRGERARDELETLTSTLASAYGLSGRRRRSGDPAERARKAVTERIRDTLRRIGRAHAELGQHLDRSINTGMFCSYTPDRAIRWET